MKQYAYLLVAALAIFIHNVASAQNVPARIKKCPDAEYPHDAKVLGLQGTTRVAVQISEEGTAISGEILKSSGHNSLDAAAIRTIMSCSFEPRMINGVAARAVVRREYTWKLEGYDPPDISKSHNSTYSTSEEITKLIVQKNLPTFSFGEIEYSDKNPTCRLGSNLLVQTPVAQYIQYAFNEELRAAKKYEYSKKTLKGKVTALEYSTFLKGYWSISMDIFLDNGKKVSISSRVEFPREGMAPAICDTAALFFPILIQQLFRNMLSNDDFIDKMSQSTSTSSPSQAEILFWETIKGSNSNRDFEAYLRQFPNGIFAELAKSRIVAAPDKVE